MRDGDRQRVDVMMLERRRVLWGAVGVAGVVLLAGRRLRAQALPPVMDAPAAASLAGAGGLLVDVRTPREQRESGTPKGAVEVPLQDDELTFRSSFAADVLAAADGDRDRPVALICANGQRSLFAAKYLATQGFTQVFSVAEGLFGSNFGPGWTRRGLPLEPCPTC